MIGQGFDDPSFVKKCQHARATVNKKLKALRSAVNSGADDDVKQLVQWLLTDPVSHLDAVVETARSPKVKKLSAAQCLNIASEIDPFSPQSEIVRIRLRPKKSGKPRIISEFGPKARAGHHMVQGILSAFHRPRPFQFTHRGHAKAVKRALAVIKSGKLWFAHLD